jgi:hypothetical protein
MRHTQMVWSQKFEVLGLVAFMSAIFVLQKYCIPHLAQVQLASPSEQLGFPLSGAYGNPSDPQDSQVDAKSAVSDKPGEQQ